jgi:ribosomal-protein-alanine N-acetyltransferase
MKNLIFQTERLTVRNYTEDDKDNFFSLGGNADVMRYIRPVQTKEQSDKFLAEVIAFSKANPLMGRWAAEEKNTGRFVGSFAIIYIEGTDKIQLGYSLLKKEWGKGYATELTRAGLKYVFEIMKLPLIYAITEIANTASQHVLLKAGFQSEKVFKEEGKELQRFIFTIDNYQRIAL